MPRISAEAKINSQLQNLQIPTLPGCVRFLAPCCAQWFNLFITTVSCSDIWTTKHSRGSGNLTPPEVNIPQPVVSLHYANIFFANRLLF